jgi:nucleoside-diphosphate-sugar epimerase
MKVLIVGGTGLISAGIVKHLLARKAEITVFNRGKRDASAHAGIRQITGDRNDEAAFENAFADERFDAVIDMICFKSKQAESSVRAFAGRCDHFIFCSTVCTYAPGIPARVLIDETYPLLPPVGDDYGQAKVACEQIFQRAHEQKKFKATIIRPSCTYGPGNNLVDQLGSKPTSWWRIEQGLPILCGGDGLALWQATHRDDCGKLFAYAVGNAKTHGKAYNATNDEVMTWRDYYRQTAAALGRKATLLFMPMDWIRKQDPKGCWLYGVSRWHAGYDSSAAKRDVPEFRCEIGIERGAKETFADMRRRGQWGGEDPQYQQMVDKALQLGMEPTEA